VVTVATVVIAATAVVRVDRAASTITISIMPLIVNKYTPINNNNSNSINSNSIIRLIKTSMAVYSG
jgi:hypothetical protein